MGFILDKIQNDLSSPVFGNIIKGICGKLQEQNYTLSLLWTGKSGSSKDAQIRDFLMSEVADCYILTPSMINSPIEKTIKARNYPIIYLAENSDYIPDGIPGVQLDIIPAYKKLLKSIPSEWYGKILYTGIRESKKKVSDLLSAMSESGIPENAVKIHLYKPVELNFSFDRWAASEFARKNINLLKQQKLIWCASDLTALGIADVLEENGIVPGKDIALIGYDNIAELVPFNGKPFLTTIHPRQSELGEMTAEMALEAVSGNLIMPNRKLEGKIIFRESYKKQQKKR